ncbi:MAG: DNA topoisomerase III, partial [Lachnospiraceae bacterium]|nr:DNA topoisomerase III [Lachnospiraceae bacterium]
MYEHDNPFEERFLVITEKPSVAMMIASVLGFNDRKDGYIEGPEGVVSWCFGHLAELVLPEEYDKKYRTWSLDTLPIIPDQWKLKVPRDKMKQFRILRDLLNNAAGDKNFRFDYVVNAADPGREGEEIFNRVYALSGSRLPVKRLWVSSMEDKAIMEAFLNMKDGSEYKRLGEAATCRAQADWLVGINASRAFTKTYDCRFSVGR